MDSEITNANERLRRAREDAGLDPNTGHGPAETTTAPGESLASILARGAAHAIPSDRYASPAPRGAEVPEKFKGITLANLAELEGPSGRALGGVVGKAGRVLVGAEAVTELRRRAIGAPRVVLLGETHAGKTVAACALLQAAAERGAQRPRFFRETDLRELEALGRACTADALVLDNLGWALNGAPGESALAAQKREPACDLVDRLSLRRRESLSLIVTTWLDEAAMARAYSGGVVARVYEGAEVIRIVRPEVRR